MTLEEFSEQFQNSIIDEARYGDGVDGIGEDFKENAFTRIVLGDIEDAGAIESPVVCYFQTGTTQSAKVNAYSLPDEENRLVLVVADYSPPQNDVVAKINADEVDRAFKMGERFLQMMTSKKSINVDPGAQVHSMIHSISAKIDSIRTAQIILITNRQVAMRSEKQRPKTIGKISVSHDMWDLERIMRFRSSGMAFDPVVVDFSNLPGQGLACLSNADPALGYSTTIAVIPGIVLANLYDQYGGRLLELNVRSYLQAKGKINRGILDTLQKSPNRFLAYNNGITIVAEEVEFTPDQTRISKISGLQIVNGGQTTASIHRARKEHAADLSHVYVQAKITKVTSEDFAEVIPLISRFSNTQNKVNEVDLKANDPFHIGVERYAKGKWVPGEKSKWYYERTRGSYQTERARRGTKKFEQEFPPAQRITKEDLARYANVFDGLPHISSRGGQKSFLKFMESIGRLGKDWTPTDSEFKEIIGKAILFRSAQVIAKEIGISAFRINVVSYAVSLLSVRTEQGIDFETVWDLQALTESWQAQLRDWMPRIQDLLERGSVGTNPGEWFKSDQCWTYVKSHTTDWDMLDELTAEIAKSARKPVSASKKQNIEQCKKIEANDWLAICRWGEREGKLNRVQLDVATRLAELAFGGWRKTPTERQADEGCKIIDQFKKEAPQG